MILICEPQCWGFEHANANAALIGAVAQAFPKEELTFLAEREHVDYVKQILDTKAVAVSYQEIKIPKRDLSNLRRLKPEFAVCKLAFELGRANSTYKIVFCSVTSSFLICVKLLARRHTEAQCLVVLHNILQSIIVAPRLRPQPLFFRFRFWLSIGNIHNLRYLVLGPVIEERLKLYLPKLAGYVSAIDLPYYFERCPDHNFCEGGVINFGFYGVATTEKGADTFFRLAEELCSRPTRSRPKFTLIGQIFDKKLIKLPHSSVAIPSPSLPLNQQKYAEYGRGIDFALVLHNAQAYELVPSAAIEDAFSFLKPVIALRSPLVEYYFERMGDIGYLCDDYVDVRDTILRILEDPPIAHYRNQRINILEKREAFSPSKVSSKLRAVLELDERLQA